MIWYVIHSKLYLYKSRGGTRGQMAKLQNYTRFKHGTVFQTNKLHNGCKINIVRLINI